MAAIPGADAVSTRQQQIAELAQQAPQMGFTSLNHHLDFNLAAGGQWEHAPGWCYWCGTG